MSLESVITTAIEKILEKRLEMQLSEGKVTAVDKPNRTCHVERDGLPELFDVRLNAIVSPTGNMITIYPKVGSHVLCAVIENNPTDTVVLQATDIDEIIINDGENGGVPLVEPIATQLQAIKDDLNSLKTVFKNWIVVAQDGGAALKTASTAWANQSLPDVEAAELQNEKFKH